MKPPLFSISLLMALATCENPEYQTVWYRYASRKCLQRQEAHIVRPIAGIPGCVYLAWADFPKTLCHSRPAQCGSAYQQYDTRGIRRGSCRRRSTSSEKCSVKSKKLTRGKFGEMLTAEKIWLILICWQMSLLCGDVHLQNSPLPLHHDRGPSQGHHPGQPYSCSWWQPHSAEVVLTQQPSGVVQRSSWRCHGDNLKSRQLFALRFASCCNSHIQLTIDKLKLSIFSSHGIWKRWVVTSCRAMLVVL